VTAVRAADQDGLEPGDYHLDELTPRGGAHWMRTKPSPSISARRYTYLRYATDLSAGTIDPEDLNPQWHASPRSLYPRDALLAGLGENTSPVAAAAGAAIGAVSGLKHQLAIARQKQDATAIEHIVMNMERWRWLPDDSGSRYLIVTFRRSASTRSKTAERARHEGGHRQKASPTPVLADRMTTVVFSPYWNIPQGHRAEGDLPKVEWPIRHLGKKPHGGDANGNYRQLPGQGNSLGQ